MNPSSMICKEMNEILSQYKGSEIQVTTARGRTYTVSSKVKDTDGSWKEINYFPITAGQCEICNNSFSGIWAVIEHGEDFVKINPSLFHKSLSHCIDSNKGLSDQFKKVFLE